MRHEWVNRLRWALLALADQASLARYEGDVDRMVDRPAKRQLTARRRPSFATRHPATGEPARAKNVPGAHIFRQK